jgi:hypothetical protein
MIKSRLAKAIAALVAATIVIVGVCLFFELRDRSVYLSIAVPAAFILIGLDAFLYILMGRRGFGLIPKARSTEDAQQRK